MSASSGDARRITIDVPIKGLAEYLAKRGRPSGGCPEGEGGLAMGILIGRAPGCWSRASPGGKALSAPST